MACIIYTWTGTLSDTLGSAARVFHTGPGEYMGACLHKTGGSETADGEIVIYRETDKTKRIAMDDMDVSIDANVATAAPNARMRKGQKFCWTARAKTSAKTLIGEWRLHVTVPGPDGEVKEIPLTENPSTADEQP